MKKIFIIAGEPSGDLHASNLVKSFKKENCSVDFQGWGGDFMEREGVEIKNHLKNLSFMGFLEVLLNWRQIIQNFVICKKTTASLSSGLNYNG
jgi:lipid-A-disaccharide synthase